MEKGLGGKGGEKATDKRGRPTGLRHLPNGEAALRLKRLVQTHTLLNFPEGGGWENKGGHNYTHRSGKARLAGCAGDGNKHLKSKG